MNNTRVPRATDHVQQEEEFSLYCCYPKLGHLSKLSKLTMKSKRSCSCYTAVTLPLIRLTSLVNSPCRAGGGVSEALEGAEHGHALPLAETELLTHCVNDGLATGVNAEVLKCQLEVRHVCLYGIAHHLHSQSRSNYTAINTSEYQKLCSRTYQSKLAIKQCVVVFIGKRRK